MIQKKIYTLFVFLLLVLRLATLGYPDLTDPSESRFANAARHMIETGDWITPKIIELKTGWEPYLAKPPLHIWATAISFEIFGVSPWSARLVPFLAVCMTFFWIWLLTGAYVKEVQRESTLLFASLPAVFFLCCSSTTDPLLMMWITGSITTALLSLKKEDKRWWYLHFILLGLGFLTKGPVAVLLAWAPLCLWMLYERSFALLRSLPWLVGPLLFLAVASPWYILSEIRNPGFIYYFFIQENIGRYLYKDFGIKFGSTHKKPYGTSILYFIVLLLPWSLALACALSRSGRDAFMKLWKESTFVRILFIWTLFPAVFFIFARQILPTYLYPSIVPGIILTALSLRTTRESFIRNVIIALLLICGVTLGFSPTISKKISFRDLGEKIIQLNASGDAQKHCSSFMFYIKLPQGLYYYHRDLIGDFKIIEDISQIDSVGDACVFLPEKVLHNELHNAKVATLATSNHWAVIKRQ